MSDYYSPFRDYSKREKLYQFVADEFKLASTPVHYFEFGVASGASFSWWLKQNNHQQSQFFGFDTFEGLPEDWGGFYAKGDMSHSIPTVNDPRAVFVKGLFQDTLSDFIQQHQAVLKSPQQKIIHMDADLYSATIFTLSQLYPYLNKGDIIMFDEFNVALHEFKAYLEFTGNFYISLKPVAAVNNFYQAAFVVA
jgi:O-methyltransferase